MDSGSKACSANGLEAPQGLGRQRLETALKINVHRRVNHSRARETVQKCPSIQVQPSHPLEHICSRSTVSLEERLDVVSF
ncbi:hypothetical protein PAXRUDRAFT_832307 [Paxillus rubicundulus Ve08.2h10]|uniref:Uncharacterized protein n=1 Tax=Paxillus rubicundulus Ve08.2h10 TaxID=930991 RepID=A0A0D0D2J1_9AGAM|nr:hypothetical protein PAXRUDRAFT_832307 [Paxillus rubicundulus Ve08.2h10]